MSGRLLSYKVLLLASLVPATPVWAQSDEIVVTARKREESILKVPVIATAITDETLSTFGTHDLKTLAAQVPSLRIGSNLGSFGNQLSIRGIGNNTLNATVDQAVSLNIDGLQMTQGLAYSVGLFDVGQVEVLEGPQALFFGKASTGGVISLRSQDPTDQVEVLGRFGYEAEAEEKKAELILSGPVADTLKLRLASSYSKINGFFKNLAVGTAALGGQTPRHRDFAPTEEVILRGTVLWSPASNFDVRLKANYNWQETQGDDGALQMTSCPTGVGALPGLPEFISSEEDCRVDRTIRVVDMVPALYPGIRNGGVQFKRLWQAFGTLEMNWEPTEALTVTSVTGYYKLDSQDLFNGTGTSAAGPLFALDNGFLRDDFSQEIRLNSDLPGPWNFTLGGFYQNGSSRQNLNGLFNQALVPLPYFQKGYYIVDARTYSLFGQVRYKIIPELEITAGGRWTDETRELTQVNEFPRFDDMGNITVPVGTIATGVPKIGSRHFDPEFTITYTPSDVLTLFASYKEATKSGGFQTTIMQPPGTDLSFRDEHVRGGEAGVKGELFDRAVRFSFAGYYYDYNDLQVGENRVTSAGLIVRTINAGTAKVRGAQLSVDYRPAQVSGLNLRGAVNYNHARFGTFPNGPCWGGQTIAQGCNLSPNPLLLDPNTGQPQFTKQDLSGRPLVKAPDWALNLGGDYSLPIGGGMTLKLGANVAYTGAYYTDLAERGDMIQDDFVKVDASLAVQGPEDRWEVALIGNNLGNKLTTGYCANSLYISGVLPAGQITGGTTSGFAGPDGVACAIDRGREIWMRLTLRPFGG